MVRKPRVVDAWLLLEQKTTAIHTPPYCREGEDMDRTGSPRPSWAPPNHRSRNDSKWKNDMNWSYRSLSLFAARLLYWPIDYRNQKSNRTHIKFGQTNSQLMDWSDERYSEAELNEMNCPVVGGRGVVIDWEEEASVAADRLIHCFFYCQCQSGALWWIVG
jgi:hypothetical protein